MTASRGPSRAVAVLLSVVAAAVLMIVGALPAAAHNTLTASDPAAGGVVTTLPRSFSLTFNDQVKDQFVTVVLTPDGADPITLSPTVDGPTVTATLPAAAASPEPTGDRAYRLGYRVISADDHPISGSIDFTVGTTAVAFGPSAGVAAADGSTAPVADSDSGTDDGTGPTWWIVTAAVVAGAGAAAVAAGRRRTRRPDPDTTPAPTPPR